MEKPNYNIDELIKDYKNFLEHSNIIPEGKIILSPLIKQTIDDIYNSYKSSIYNVLFLLLTGDIDKNDIKSTVNSLILSSHLPLSIIVIGVGNHNFSQAKELFNLDNKYSSEGMPKNRDNIIFKMVKNRSETISALEYCLKELRKQMIEFYQIIKYKEEDEVDVKGSFAKVSIMFERNFKESKGLKESFFRPEESISQTPGRTYTLPGEEEDSLFGSNSNNTFNNSNSNIQIENPKNSNNTFSSNSSNDQGKYILKDSSMETPNPSGTYSYKKNSEKEEKKGKEGSSGGSGFNSTNGSDLKESGFSILDNK